MAIRCLDLGIWFQNLWGKDTIENQSPFSYSRIIDPFSAWQDQIQSQGRKWGLEGARYPSLGMISQQNVMEGSLEVDCSSIFRWQMRGFVKCGWSDWYCLKFDQYFVILPPYWYLGKFLVLVPPLSLSYRPSLLQVLQVLFSGSLSNWRVYGWRS